MSTREVREKLEKQLQLLSKLSERNDLSVEEHLAIAREIVNTCNAIAFFPVG